MKTINIPFTAGNVNKFGESQCPIDVVNWEEYSYKPNVSFQIGYDNENLYLRY